MKNINLLFNNEDFSFVIVYEYNIKHNTQNTNLKLYYFNCK